MFIVASTPHENECSVTAVDICGLEVKSRVCVTPGTSLLRTLPSQSL